MTRYLPLFVRRWLHWLLNFTPLVREPARRLIPRLDLERSGAGEYDWRATGADPQFVWRKGLPAPGWYMLEVVLLHNQPLAGMRVYFHSGNGYTDDGSFYLPLKAGRLTKRLCFIPPGIKAIRIDPMESAGEFSFGHLRFARVTTAMAVDRLARRLRNMHYHWRETPLEQVMPQLRQEAESARSDWLVLAAKYYEETFARMAMAWSYPEWIARNPPHVPETMRTNRKCLAFVAVVLVHDEASLELVKRTYASIDAQDYPALRLTFLLSDGVSAQLVDWLSGAADQDARVEVKPIGELARSGDAIRDCAQMYPEHWVTVMEPGDALSADAFWWVADEVLKNPGVALVYSDEDCLDAGGGRFGPSFRPDWNPDLLCSRNYTGKAVWVRAAELIGVESLAGIGLAAQRYNWVVRLGLARKLPVIHVPRVLYHGAADGCPGQQDLAECHQILAAWLREQSPGISADVVEEAGGFRVCHVLPDTPPLVSLLIPTRNGVDILQPCVDAILSRTDYPELEVIILDNQTDCPRTLRYMQSVTRDSRVRVLTWDHPFNYSAINNFGATQARGDIIGLINNDIEPINRDWLREMVSHAMRPEVGCVGAKLYYSNDTIQHAGVILGIGGVAGHSHKYLERDARGYENRLKLVQNLSAVTGACLLLRKAVFDEVGGLEEANLAVAFNDVDLCLRVREAGYRNVWTPYAEAYHHESVSRGADDTPEKRERADREAVYMRERWGNELDNDPAYNPNLTLIHEDFSLR